MAFFFHQPLEEKMKVEANKYMRGYTLMNEETLDAKTQKCGKDGNVYEFVTFMIHAMIMQTAVGDTKEGYYICRHVDLDSEEMKLPLHGPNLFPNEQNYPNFKRVMEQYHVELCKLGYGVAQLFAEAAGASGEFAKEGMFDK